MDPLTHGLLGGCLGAATGDFRERRWRFLAATLGALAPDLDVLARFTTDMLSFLEWHRHLSHSLLAAPVIGLAVAIGFRLFCRARQCPEAGVIWLMATLGAVSHALLDACTGFGVVLLWPWESTRFAWNVVSVVDPLVTIPLLLLALVTLWREQPSAPRIGVCWVAVLMGFGLWQQHRVEQVIERLASQRGHFIGMHSVRPSFGNQVLWRSVYLHGDTFHIDSVHAGFSVDVMGSSEVAWQPWETLELPASSIQRLDARRFDQLANGFTVLDPENPRRFGDLRFSMLPDSATPLWGLELQPEQADQHASFYTDRSMTPAQRERFIQQLLGRYSKPEEMADE